ncbi:hypothetical protein ACFSTE_18685 [Aquimarina hainanensis]|uniref:ATP-binding protein n=1 Tax=Aquimarina hainanensis TaxID=1578017 RepID=A0ABW5NCA5_9FLAO|nr:hypothetical protein [Aquimarina sp. TRL1]QKX06644.1 hypothetical protein HN014_17560 [Aquimarina sp. TRL1]
MRVILIVLLLTVCSVSLGISQEAGFTKRLKKPRLVKLWETDTVLKDVESAIYDSTNQVIYATSINGHWLKANGKGFISKIGLDGNITCHKWIDAIEGPTGTAMYNNKLYVADFDTILEIDIKTATITNSHKIPATERINDLTVAEDGTLYGSGTKSGKLIALQDNKATVIASDLEWPNGLLYEKDKLLIGLGDNTVIDYNVKTNSSNVLTKDISNPDGIVAIGNGDYLISSWQGMIYYVTSNGDKILLLDTVEKKENAADITYIPSLRMVLVPAMLQHKLIAYTLIDED